MSWYLKRSCTWIQNLQTKPAHYCYYKFRYICNMYTGSRSSPKDKPDYKKLVLVLIIIASVVRCLLASVIELGNDEVYYWSYSQHLQWNYFDHPLMVALLIRLGTFNQYLENHELFIRLGSIISSAFSTWFIYKTVETIHSQRAGFFAAILYTSSLYSSIISGVFIMPDSPQMFFWTASLYLLANLLNGNDKKTAWWVLFGITTGLTIMSKIHGVFIWSGLGLYIIFSKRDWLLNYRLYLSILIAGMIVTPFFNWNIQSNFITYRYHSAMIEGSIFHFRFANFFREITGEVFYSNPINFFLIVSALISFFRKKQTINLFVPATVLIALPMIGVLMTIALFNTTLPHWSGPAYVTLLPLAASYLAERINISPRKIKLLHWAGGLMIIIVISGTLVINFFPGTMSRKKEYPETGKGDFTLDLYGWKEVVIPIRIAIKDDLAKGIMNENSVIVCNKWFPAAHIDYYIAQKTGIPVIGLGYMYDLHHYEWLNAYRLGSKSFTDAYCIVPSNYNCDVQEVYGNLFSSRDTLGVFPAYRNGKVCRFFTVYRLKNFTGTVPKVF